MQYAVYGAADAELAIQHDFDGILVSNHGGRQLNSVPASLDVLREVVPVEKGRIPIGIDGGIGRGTDIFKALALGADFCLAGRPAIWGLAVSYGIQTHSEYTRTHLLAFVVRWTERRRAWHQSLVRRVRDCHGIKGTQQTKIQVQFFSHI